MDWWHRNIMPKIAEAYQNSQTAKKVAGFITYIALKLHEICFKSVISTLNQPIRTSVQHLTDKCHLRCSQLNKWVLSFFCEDVNGNRRGPQFDRESVPCRWPGHHEVTLTDGGLCTWHNECPAVHWAQLPPADDGRDGSADVSQVGWCQTVQAQHLSRK